MDDGRAIEVIYTWADTSVAEYVDSLKEEVARAVALPPWAMQNMDAARRHQLDMWRATEIIRREIVHLVNMYMTPTIIMSKGSDL